jgi:antitoxin component HigA of HigAB toxin-antitoxin module
MRYYRFTFLNSFCDNFAMKRPLNFAMVDISPKFIDAGGGLELVVLTRVEFDELSALAAEAEEDLADLALDDARKAEIEADPEAVLPKEVSAMLLRGDRLLKALRKWRGISQSDLAAQTGLVQGYVSDLESGRRAGTAETLALLAKHLDIDPSWIMY